MSQLDLSGCKKRKRSERVFKFKSFGERGHPVQFNGSFQENVRALLEFGRIETGLCGKMPIWSFQLEVRRNPLLHLFLFIVEEPVEFSLELRCKHCQYIGWGHHMICSKKYHFLLPSTKAGSSGEYCKSNVIELHGDHGHIMHGVFHSNGFGHLLCINGSDLAGYQIMEFWDRLCSGLGARKVTLRDVATRKGMDLRLLHTLAYGKTWFGRWDYTFGRGSYNINIETYENAVKSIRNIPLNFLSQNIGSQNEIIPVILPRYQFLSGHSLFTLGDLFHFMMELKHRTPKETKNDYIHSHFPTIMSDSSCRWSPKRVEMAIHVVVEALKRTEFRWVSRQHVRDSARAYIGDTGLLDFVLKSLGNQIVGKYFVRRCLNPVTKVLEYCLEDMSQALPKQESLGFIAGKVLKPQKKISLSHLMKDLFHMYKTILRERQHEMTSNGVLTTITMASRVILDTKYLVKDYSKSIITTHGESNTREICCAVVLSNDTETSFQRQEAETPSHRFVLTTDATFHELRFEAEKMFREVYFGLRNFKADSIRYMSPKASDAVFNMVKPGSKIVFEAKQSGEMIIEGLSTYNVDCVCGAKDDDGERMVLCDVCQVSQHTRCVGISDADRVPDIYLCGKCEKDVLRFSSLP